MKYFAYVVDGNVNEIIPEFNPDLPGFSLNERYAPDFIKHLIEIPENLEVEQNWTYSEVNGFQPPVIVESGELVDPVISEE